MKEEGTGAKRERGFRELERISGTTGEGISGRLGRLSPGLSEILVDHAYGTVYAAPELSRYAREIATVAMLAAGGFGSELRIHIDAALRVGVSMAELVALAEHVSLYAGVPRTIEMADALLESLDGTPSAFPASSMGVRFSMGDHETRLFDTGGTGPPLLFLHSVGTSRWIFEPLFGPLSSTHRVLAFDLRGHGAASGAPGPLSFEGWSRDIVFLLDHLGIGKAHVAGISMGATLSLSFGERHPDRASSLTLMGPPSPDPEKYRERARAVLEEGGEGQMPATLARWFTPAFLAGNPWGVRICRENLLRMNREELAQSFLALAKMPLLPSSPTVLPFPLTFVAGGRDQSVPADSVAEFSRRYEGAVLRTIGEAPHQMTLETPGPLVEILRRSAGGTP